MNKLLPFLFLLSFSTQAQELLHCGADEMRIATLKANPKIAEAVIERDAELEAFTREYALLQHFDKLSVTSQGTPKGGQIYTIPVVFHVIHKYGNENISREQILDGLRILNETFRKTREDTADMVAAFKPIHADCEIEFHLATKDPEGNCHSGINRIASTLTNVGDHQVKELVHWDPSMYLNVYVVSNAAGLAGHCVWPADADTIPEWDGIVIAHSYVGTIGTSDLTRSVAFAHECGHYLNLHHIWGGNNVPGFYYLPVGQQSNCGEDDQVADTPNTIGWSTCNLSAASCGNTVDNVQNAMDYSYCNVMFTEGQKMRMHAALNSSIANRNNLWTPANLAATGVEPSSGLCAADFTADKQVVCSSFENEITFTETAYHGAIDSLSWTFENGTPASSTATSPTVTYTEPGTHDVSLTVYANGQSAQVTRPDFVTVIEDSTYQFPFWDWFEGYDPLAEQKWSTVSLDEDNAWTVTDIGYHSAGHSAMIDNWGSDRLTVDELISPPIDLSGVGQMRLAFKYAFGSSKAVSSSTKLQIQVRKDCESNWTTRLNLIGSNLETAPQQSAPFEPQVESLWMQEDINLPST
ncbi:MAG: PKD domain-containing protein, partial [Flavobacteriales bacterium]|nr:PKD domain-containing protein [Flavobacteriales bacterium]